LEIRHYRSPEAYYVGLEYAAGVQRPNPNGVYEDGHNPGDAEGCSGLDGPAFRAEDTV
jgi:hypothetical protein